MPRKTKTKTCPETKEAKTVVKKELQVLTSKMEKLSQYEKSQIAELKTQLKGLQIQKKVKRGMAPGAVDLIKQTIYPVSLRKPVRSPDFDLVPVGVFRSKTIIPVYPNTNVTSVASGNAGRFAVVIAPNLGFLNTGPASGSWSAGRNTVSQGPTSATNGATFATSSNMTLNCLAAFFDPAHNWVPSTAWDTGAWNFVKDSQNVEILGSSGAGTGTWPSGYTTGAASCYRAIAQSVWFRCSESAFQNGGDVAAALVHAPIVGTVCPNEGPQATVGGTYRDPGCLLNWENLADYPTAYQGNLKKGTYSWMLPMPRNVLTTNAAESGALLGPQNPWFCISGQAQPDTSGGYPSTIGMIEVETVYEFQSTNQFIESKIKPFDYQLMQDWLQSVYGLPTSMSNEEHTSWVSKVLRFLAMAGAAGLTVATGGTAALAIGAGLSAGAAARAIV